MNDDSRKNGPTRGPKEQAPRSWRTRAKTLTGAPGAGPMRPVEPNQTPLTRAPRPPARLKTHGYDQEPSLAGAWHQTSAQDAPTGQVSSSIKASDLDQNERTQVGQALPTPRQRLSPAKRDWLGTAEMLFLGLLLLCALLPCADAGAAIAPWAEWTAPTSPGFIALALLAWLGAAALAPLKTRGRALMCALLGLMALIAGLFSLKLQLNAGSFDHHPTVKLLTAGPVGARTLIITAAVALPFALGWRYRVPTSVGARIVLSTAVLLILSCYLLLPQLTSTGQQAPIVALWTGIQDSAWIGDRIACGLAILPALVALASLYALRKSPTDGLARPLALAFFMATMSPLLILALYSAPLNQWAATMSPLKSCLILTVGLVASATGLAHLPKAARD